MLSRTTLSSLLVLLLLAGAGCASETDSPASASDAEATDQAITNAGTTAGYPAVGFIVVGDYQGTCTGTLIAPQLVLTAAHCIHYTRASMRVWLGGNWYLADAWHWNVGFNPDAVGMAPEGDIDVGVVHLQSPVYGVTPLPLASWVPSTGDTFTAVGFGETSSGRRDYGNRRAAFATVGSVAGTWFLGSGAASPCHGDSGGPALAANGTILGVFARMHNSCAGGPNGFAYVPVAPLRGWMSTQF